MSDGILTEERKHLLDRYALLLKIDSTIAQKVTEDRIKQKVNREER